MENLGAQSKEQTYSVAQTADNEKLSMGFQFGKQKTKRRKWARFAGALFWNWDKWEKNAR